MELALSILNILLSIVSNYFMIATTIVFLKCFYDPCFQWGRKKAIFLLVYTLIDTALNIVLVNYYIDNSFFAIFLFCYEFIFGTFVIIYDYSGKRFRGIIRYAWVISVITTCSGMIQEIGSMYVFPDYILFNTSLSFETTFPQAIFILFLYVIFYTPIFFYLYFRICKQKIFLSVQKRDRIFMLIYSLLCIAFGFIFDYSGKSGRFSLMIMGITFILSAMLLPVFIYSLRISTHYQQRTKLQEVYMQSELEHFRQYMHAQEETRRFRHDIRNNLLCMNEMVTTGNNERLEQYLKDLLEITNSLSFKYVSGDELLDSILNSKAHVMEQHGIRFELDGVLAGGLHWKPMDICAVFANALDNAIEACQRVAVERRSISMNIKATPQFWLVTIENPVAEQVDTTKIFHKNGGYTSKSDSSRHGIGTYSMKHTIESYGDMLKAECTDETFTLEIMIDRTED